MQLDNKTIEIVKSTVPILRARGEEITKAFYADMFERYPSVKGMFDMEKQKNGKQPKALALAILNAAENIENLEAIRKQITNIGNVHVKLNVKPKHYPIVGECLLKALTTVLKDAATPDILEAWGKAYNAIAAFYIEVEKGLYEKNS